MALSPTATLVPKSRRLAGTYLKACHSELWEWIFDVAAEKGLLLILLLAGLINEATNWF